MKTIAVITATRAEYGLLAPVIRQLRAQESEEFRTEVVVTGAHLSEKYGNTVCEIEQDGIRIDERVPISVESESAQDISENQSEALVKFTHLFVRKQYAAVVLLGDRYEMLAIAIAAGNTHTPIFHLCGGDTTEGAMDEWIRHSITKMSYLHFVTNADSYRRVVQLGENPERVFDYGSTSIDNIISQANVPKREALYSIGLPDCSYVMCTYHPVTMENQRLEEKINDFLDVIRCHRELEFIVTKSNADQGGAHINRILDAAEDKIPNLHVYTSLGVTRYLSLVKHAEFVLGNSSSGIIEAPALKVPTVNIGNRQRGRLQADSIINCGEGKEEIEKAVCRAMDPEFRKQCKMTVSPYGNGNAAEKIAGKILDVVLHDTINLKKKFYDL